MGITMPEVSESAKVQIDSMTKDELLQEVHLGNSSRFQRANFAYLQARLAVVEGQELDQHQQEVVKVAKEANDIAKDSKKYAIWAIFISLIAIVIPMCSSK